MTLFDDEPRIPEFPDRPEDLAEGGGVDQGPGDPERSRDLPARADASGAEDGPGLFTRLLRRVGDWEIARDVRRGRFQMPTADHCWMATRRPAGRWRYIRTYPTFWSTRRMWHVIPFILAGLLIRNVFRVPVRRYH